MSTLDFASSKGKPGVVVGSLNMDLVLRVPHAQATAGRHAFIVASFPP